MNILCKLFNLIKRKDIVFYLSSKAYKMAMSKEALKRKYNSKEISEWTYYKKLWQLMGRLSMLEEIIDMLAKK